MAEGVPEKQRSKFRTHESSYATLFTNVNSPHTLPDIHFSSADEDLFHPVRLSL
jgi:hypothetical protein